MTNIVYLQGRNYQRIGLNWHTHFRNVSDGELLVYSDTPSVYENAGCTVKSLQSLLQPTAKLGGRTQTIFHAKTLCWINHLKHKGDFVLSDADAIWVKDIDPLAKDLLAQFDGVFSIVTHPKAYPEPVSRITGFTLCGGFFGLASNARVIRFVDHIMNSYNENFQNTLNRQLFRGIKHELIGSNDEGYTLHLPRFDIRFRLLDKYTVFRGSRSRKIEDKVRVYHPLSAKSAKQTEAVLRIQGLWDSAVAE